MPNTKQEELREKFYDYSVANVVDRDTGLQHYAIHPDDLLKIINSEVTAALEELAGSIEKWEDDDSRVSLTRDDIFKTIQSIKERYQ